MRSLPGNWCAISQVLMTKSCRAVFEFSKKELGSPSTKRRWGGERGGLAQKPCKKKNPRSQQAALYKGHSQDGARENSEPYSPCHHPGPCTAQTCSCRQTGNFCEKFCYCSLDCSHRYHTSTPSHAPVLT